MDLQLKQRVVGAAVLVVLGVIFIPIFLESGTHDELVSDVAQLPDAPDKPFEPSVQPLDEAEVEAMAREARANTLPAPIVEAVPEQGPSDERGQPETTPTTTDQPATEAVPTEARVEVPDAPKAVEVGVGVPASPPSEAQDAWTVQLGSFGNVENARRLIDRLRDKGYPGYLQRQAEGDTTVFKVRVGPQVARAEAESVRDRLTKDFDMKGMLRKYR